MDEDIEFDPTFRMFPGVDLALWLNIAVGVALVAALVTAVLLLA